MLKSEPNPKIIQFLDKIILNSKKFNIKDTILIVGSHRGGTTWLMEIFGSLPRYTFLYEPLNPLRFPESFKIGFRSRTYLPVNVNWLEGEEYLRRSFSGRVYSLQPLYKTEIEMIMHRLLGDKLIVKCVRMNRLLPWIASRFQLRGIFFIIRHPCAVVASQLKTGWTGYHPASPPYKDIIPTPKQIVDEASEIDVLDDSLRNRLKKIKTTEEILAAIWCLDNYVPLSYHKPYPWITIIYEKLIKNGEKEIARLFNEIGEKTFPRSVSRHFKTPSMTTIKKDLNVVKKADEQLSKWKKSLSKKQIEQILSLVSDFGLDFYTEEIEPDYDNIGVKI